MAGAASVRSSCPGGFNRAGFSVTLKGPLQHLYSPALLGRADVAAPSAGLGIWMQLSQNAFRTDLVFAAVLLSVALFASVRIAERLTIPWYAASRRRPAT